MKKTTLTALILGMFLAGCGSGSGSDGGSNHNSGNDPSNAPIAGNFSFTALGNSDTVRATNVGLLSAGTLSGAELISVQSPTARGGTVSAQSDGSYLYSAPVNATGIDSFNFEIANNSGHSVGTVNIMLNGTGFFVNNQAAPGGIGTQSSPFQTLAQVQAASAGVNGAEIVVFQGDGTSNGYNTPFSLKSGQILRGLSSSATPVLTGPISFSSGNRLEDVRIFATPGGVSAVNAVGASNGTINRVTIANCSSAGNLTDATGNFTVSNSGTSNLNGFGFGTFNTVGTLNWTVNNCSFTNSTQCSVCEFSNAASAQNLTVSGCSFISGRQFEISTLANTTGSAVGLNVNNCTVSGGGLASRGVDVSVIGGSAFTAIIAGNNVTGCTGEGILIATSGNSTNRVKMASNRILGNLANRGVVMASANTNTACLVLTNNTSDAFEIRQNNTSVFNIEQLATAGTRNTGNIVTAGTLTDVAAGFCGLP